MRTYWPAPRRGAFNSSGMETSDKHLLKRRFFADEVAGVVGASPLEPAAEPPPPASSFAFASLMALANSALFVMVFIKVGRVLSEGKSSTMDFLKSPVLLVKYAFSRSQFWQITESSTMAMRVRGKVACGDAVPDNGANGLRGGKMGPEEEGE